MQQTTRVLHLRLRLKDRHARALQEQTRAVNFLWNYCNELSIKPREREQRPSRGNRKLRAGRTSRDVARE